MKNWKFYENKVPGKKDSLIIMIDPYYSHSTKISNEIVIGEYKNKRLNETEILELTKMNKEEIVNLIRNSDFGYLWGYHNA